MGEENEDEIRSHVCAWCGEAATKSCGMCGEVWFCSKEHQRLNWDDHYRECKAYRVKKSQEAGQFLVASRGIKAGTVILQDEPILVSPLGTSNLMCLSCHAPIYEDNFFKCPECFWPMCSMDCAWANVHDEECNILSRDTSHCGAPHTQGETPRYDLIMVLRCLLLKEGNPEMWKEVLTMASHGQILKAKQDPYQIAAVRYLTEICKVDYATDTVHHVRGAILANALEIRGPKGDRLRALYPTIRLLNHSCIPNIHLSANLDGVMEAKAAVNISKGEELHITYTGTDVPLWERQACLTSSHYFNCSCRRCTDPLELGTMFSSSTCILCPQEIMQHTIRNGDIVWICSKCGTECSVEEMKQEIEDWTFRFEMNELFGSGTLHKISHALAIVEHHFHLSHYMWLKAGQAALRKIAYNTSFAAVKLKKYIWENILHIYNKLEPGLTRRRGMTLVELARATVNLASQEFLAKGDLSVHQIDRYLRESKDWYNEGYQILRQEPSGTPERELAYSIPLTISIITEDLKDLGVFLKEHNFQLQFDNDFGLRIWE